MISFVRNKRKLYFIYLLIISIFQETYQYCAINFPNPSEKFSKKFDLKINSESEKFTNHVSYIPGKTYDITIVVNNRLKESKFGIEEVYVKADQVPINSETSNEIKYNDVGKLLYNFTGGSRVDLCINKFYVKFFYNLPEETTFFWTAPKNAHGCITILVIVQLKNRQDESYLEEKTHVICDPQVNQQNEMQGDQPEAFNCAIKMTPDPVKTCNIGSTAIYRMIIENNWNHINHWKDWPGRDGYVPKLTQYLGASHTTNFDIYHIGGMATPAIQQFCTNGSYKTLQKDFYKSGNNILTVILARSLEATPGSAKRSALVVVNSTYHLITFLSHLEPSPDWCTGLSRFDICSGKCTWPDKITVPLYPWDAGVYGGESYISMKDVEARSPICAITNKWPKDNPFTKIDGKLQNIGTVTFKLIQEYNKDKNAYCNPDNTALQDEGYSMEITQKFSTLNDQKQEEKTRHCQLSDWTEWSTCSKTCGTGERVRYRKIIKGKPEKCINLLLKEVEKCDYKCLKQLTSDNCLLRLWTEWSPCNATCLQSGISYRERVFIDEEEKKQCSIYPDMKKIEICSQASTRCDPAKICKEYLNTGELCEWSSPSVRYFFDLTTDTCKPFTFKGCYGGLNNFHKKEECENICSKFIQHESKYRTRPPDDYEYRCNSPVSWGQDCKNRVPAYHWYFDTINQKCYPFYYSGCRGSANKFQTKKECESICLKKIEVLSTVATIEDEICTFTQWSEWTSCTGDCQQTRTRNRSLTSTAVNCNDEISEIEKCPSSACQNKKVTVKVIKPKHEWKKCIYSPWSVWSSCSAVCGKGVRERVRTRKTHKCIPEFPQYSHLESCYNDCRMY